MNCERPLVFVKRTESLTSCPAFTHRPSRILIELMVAIFDPFVVTAPGSIAVVPSYVHVITRS